MADLNDLRRRLEPVAREFDLDLIVLFGSAAAGKTTRSSDVDLAVRGPRSVDLVAVTHRLIGVLRRDGVDVSDLRTAGPTLGFMVAKYGRPVIERTRGAFLDFHSLACRKYWDAAKFRVARRELLDRFAERSGA